MTGDRFISETYLYFLSLSFADNNHFSSPWFLWRDDSPKRSQKSSILFLLFSVFVIQNRSFSTSRIQQRSIFLFVIADNQEWQSKWYSRKRHGVSRRWVGELSVATLALRNVNLLLLLLLLPIPLGGICQGHGPRKTRCRPVTRRRRSQSHHWFY